MRITAAVVDELDGPFQLTELELDDPGPGEVLVRLVATGICHTDGLARHGDLPFPLPGVLGHEGAGTVAAVGAGVNGFAVGDPVVIGWPSCGACRNCRAGEPRYCARLGEVLVGGGRLDGDPALRRPDGGIVSSHFFGQSSFATHALTTAAALVKVPPGLPLEIMGPLACGVSTGAGAVFNTARPGPGASLAVFGVGTVGFAAVMAARNSPATRIIAVDRHDVRLTPGQGTRRHAHGQRRRRRPGARGRRHLRWAGRLPRSNAPASSAWSGRRPTRSACSAPAFLIGGAPAGAEFNLDHISTLWGKRIVGVLGGSGRSPELIGGLDRPLRTGPVPVRPPDRVLRPGRRAGGAGPLLRRRRRQAGTEDAVTVRTCRCRWPQWSG